jgi:hypothetical protein
VGRRPDVGVGGRVGRGRDGPDRVGTAPADSLRRSGAHRSGRPPAARFDQLVGPYSREGFRHPGPALFYVLAPFVRVPGLGDLRAGLTSLGVVRFGNHDYVSVMHRTALELAVTALMLLVLAVAALRLATPATSGPVRALVGAAVAVALVGTASLGTAPKPLYPYLSGWMAVVPVGLLTALGMGVWDRLGGGPALLPRGFGRPRSIIAVLLGLALAGGSIAVASDLRTVPIQATAGSGPWPALQAGTQAGKRSTVADTALLAAWARSALPAGTKGARIVIAAPSLWPFAAGMALALERSGVSVAVEPGIWILYFGSTQVPPHSPILTLAPRSEPASGAGRAIAVTSLAILRYQPGFSG